MFRPKIGRKVKMAIRNRGVRYWNRKLIWFRHGLGAWNRKKMRKSGSRTEFYNFIILRFFFSGGLDPKKWAKNRFPAVFRLKIGRKVKMARRNRGVRYWNRKLIWFRHGLGAWNRKKMRKSGSRTEFYNFIILRFLGETSGEAKVGLQSSVRHETLGNRSWRKSWWYDRG